MSGYVIATAGHVDHGKSTLVKALTGIEPDRWEEERRRGLTIDLGFAWTALPSGRRVDFVDVPGHERFLGNMLAGLGPAPVVCFTVAADQGWQQQSSDHRDAVAALGIEAGLIAVTRADLAPEKVPEVTERARAELAGTGLESAPVVSVSVPTGEGLEDFISALDAVLGDIPEPDPAAPVRLWADRSFSISGAGTVLTGTLTAGRLQRGQELELAGERFSGPVTVRGLQSRQQNTEEILAAGRSAVNLRGVAADQTGRGDALLTPGAWMLTSSVDVRHCTGADFGHAPQEMMVHLGTATVQARCRPLGTHHARLSLERPLPVTFGDRLVLRSTDSPSIFAGVQVLDVDPPALARHGAGRRRAEVLEAMPLEGDPEGEVLRRGAVKEELLQKLGLGRIDEQRSPGSSRSADFSGNTGSSRSAGSSRDAGSSPTRPAPHAVERLSPRVLRINGWLVAADALAAWRSRLETTVDEHMRNEPLSAGLSEGAAADALELPDAALLTAVIEAAGLRREAGSIRRPSQVTTLGVAETAVVTLERELSAEPFRAPEANRLAQLGLGQRELAAAERQGRLLRLGDGVVLLPSAPAQAMPVLAGLDQPFTTSAARRALDTTRRTAIPLLEHLDSRGWTRRVDSQRREVVR